jgi:BASS family bile acid:Na+ symporter
VGPLMLSVVIDVGIPLCAFLLMFIAGTEVRMAAIAEIRHSWRATATGSIGQLITTPAIGLATIYLAAPVKPIAAAVLILSICPGGGISTYYTYLARANVALSAFITALSTILSLLTMPLWLSLLVSRGQAVVELQDVPVAFVLGQLALFMLLPVAVGAFLQHVRPDLVQRHTVFFRRMSLLVVLIVLGLTATAIQSELTTLVRDIGLSAIIFIALAMLFAHLTTVGLRPGERCVVVIESAVRNIGVALLLGRTLFSPADLAIIASFLIGYFLIELIIMVGYAMLVQRQNTEVLRIVVARD